MTGGRPVSLLAITDLKVSFDSPDGVVRAVDGIDMTVDCGETLGLVGETGCGKTVLGQAIMRLLPKTARVSGEIRYRGRDLQSLSDAEIRRLRGREMAMILQNPLSSLNPALTIGEQIAETIREHQGLKGREALARARQILEQTGISARRAAYYPHEYSGGMRQRAMIAIGLSCQPSLLIADEPTKGLDVSVQSHIVELIRAVTKEAATPRSMLLITHDLGVAAALSDLVAVMYAGKMVEYGRTRDVYKDPRHPYTRGFLGAHPGNGLRAIDGISPSLINTPPGCSFHPRCAEAGESCRQSIPPMTTVGPDHGVRCFHA